MNVIKTMMLSLMLSLMLIVVSDVLYAEPATQLKNNVSLHQRIVAHGPKSDEQDVDYFQHIFSSDGLYAFVLALDREVPDVSKAAKYVALFKKLNSANGLLTKILAELKTNNQLLRNSMLNQGVAMDG